MDMGGSDGVTLDTHLLHAATLSVAVNRAPLLYEREVEKRLASPLGRGPLGGAVMDGALPKINAARCLGFPLR